MSRQSFLPSSSLSSRRFHCIGFDVVETSFGDYRVDARFEELPRPIPGPSFPTLEQAKQHIDLTQRMLAGARPN